MPPTAPTPTVPTPTAPSPSPSVPKFAARSCKKDVKKNRFALRLNTDNYGSETSFAVYKMKKQGNFEKEIFHSGYGSFVGNTVNDLTRCLKSTTCFKVEVRDTFGDGMCCQFGNGSFQAYWGGQEVSNSSFEGGSVREFEFGNC